MARGTTLGKLLDDLRAEAHLSLNPSQNQGARAAQVKLLQREQERLWEDFDWPHLHAEREVGVQAGQRIYGMPEDMKIERLEKIDVFLDGGWCPLGPGIDGRNYSIWNSELDQRSWPPRAYRPTEDDDIEIWPIPDSNADPLTQDGTLKFYGYRNLRPLVDDGDRADLDDQMLVLYAAAELLGNAGSKDAQIKLDKANQRYKRLRGNLTPRKRTRLFGIGSAPRRHRMFVNYRPLGG